MSKNKNKNMKLMAAAMAVVITAGAAGTCGYQRTVITAKASDVDVKELQKVAEGALETDGQGTENGTEEAVITEESAEEDQGAKKEESVYVKADATGNVKNTTVTEWIKNPGNGKLSDVSELEDIENIKGDETYQVSTDAGLDWQSEGDDIYYQGTTKKELPVGVKISYKLDGKEISAKDLKGKDGKAEIHIQYSNHSKAAVDVGGESEEMFTPFTMVTAMMLPADEYQNVEIDHGKVISDADKQIVVGLGFPGIGENLKLSDGDFDFDLPEEVTITADVKNASVGPTITMATTDFLQDLDFDEMDSFDDLNDSIESLKDATNQLVDGSREAADGAGTLKDGIDTLNSKSGDLIAGVQKLDTGIASYTQGIQDLADAVNENHMAEASAQLASGSQAVQTGVNGVETILTTGNIMQKPIRTTSQISSEATDISNSLAGLQNTIENISAQAQVVNEGTPEVQCHDEAGLEGYLVSLGVEESAASGAAAQIRQYFSASPAGVEAAAEVTGEKAQALAEVQSIQGMASSLQADAGAAVSQTKNASDMLAGIFYGDGTPQNPGLLYASNMVADGTAKLSGGVQEVSNGINKLQSYNDEIRGGVSQLLQGGGQLTDGVGQLADGASALADGNQALADGMAEYKTEAIDQLTDLFDGDLSKAKNRLRAMTDLGKEYQSFGGISSDMSGSTKFIIETEGISE